MGFQNLTPFPAISWENVDSKRQWHITTLVRVKYTIHPIANSHQWELRIAAKQGELFVEDTTFNNKENCPIRYESDLIIYKPNTDIIVNATAKSILGLTEKDNCSLLIADYNNTILKEKTTKLYGKYPWIDNESNKKYKPSAFGFMSRGSKSRLNHAGTYDEDWLKNRHPYPPDDFDPRYNQAAQPDLILKGHLSVGTKFVLKNMLSRDQHDRFIIPELHCFCELVLPNGEIKRSLISIDTVLIDIDSDKTEEWSVYLSYRHYQPKPKNTEPKDIIVKYLPAAYQLDVTHG